MEGDRYLQIYEPGPPGPPDEYGQSVDLPPILHEAWGTRRDRGGREIETDDTQVGEWTVSFQVRVEGLEGIGHTWWIVDEDGTVWDLERIGEVAMPRENWIVLYCVARL